MKKVTFFILSIVGAVLSSCGTSAHYASSDSWEDGIYYRKSQQYTQNIEQENQQLEELIQKTKDEARRYTETIVVSDGQSVEIPLGEERQYALLFEGINDSTATGNTYNLNLNFYEDPWYDNYYSYNHWLYWGPSWSLYWDPFWYPSYWGPYWGFHYGYYGWYSPWYDPWYYYPVYPPYPYYPQYAYYDNKPVVYGKRDGSRSSSLSSSAQRGNFLTSNKGLNKDNSSVHHSAVDRNTNNRNIRMRQLSKIENSGTVANVSQARNSNSRSYDRLLSKGDRESLNQKTTSTKRPVNTRNTNFRKSEASRDIDNQTFRSNISRDFRNSSNRDYRNSYNNQRGNSNVNTNLRTNQRSYSGSYNSSGSLGSGGGVRSSGGSSGGGSRARR